MLIKWYVDNHAHYGFIIYVGLRLSAKNAFLKNCRPNVGQIMIFALFWIGFEKMKKAEIPLVYAIFTA